MTTPMEDSLILYGKEAEDFLYGLDRPLSKKEKRLFKEINSQRRVYLWDDSPKGNKPIKF